jgi:hypothetical protein
VRGTRASIVGPAGAMSPPGGQRCKRRVACKVCWQLSFVLPLGAAYVALTDSRSVHVSHAERAGWLRGRLGEAGRLVWCSMLAYAASGIRMSMVIWDRTGGELFGVRTWRAGTGILDLHFPICFA